MFKQKKPVYAPMLSTFGGGSVRGFGGGGVAGGGDAQIVYPDPTHTSTINMPYKSSTSVYSTVIGTLTNEDGTKLWSGEYASSNRFAVWSTSSGSWASASNWSGTGNNALLNLNGYTAQERPSHAYWFDDGSSALISGVDSGNIFTVSCSTAYDLGTGTYNDVESGNWYSLKVNGGGGGWAFPNSDCSTIVAKGYPSNNAIMRTELSTAGDLSSASGYGSNDTLVSGNTWGLTSIAGADVSPDGRMIVDLEYSGGSTRIVDLGAGKDIWTATTTDFANASYYNGPTIQINTSSNSLSGLKFDWYNQAGLTNGNMRFFCVRTNIGTTIQDLGVGEWPIM